MSKQESKDPLAGYRPVLNFDLRHAGPLDAQLKRDEYVQLYHPKWREPTVERLCDLPDWFNLAGFYWKPCDAIDSPP